MRHIQLPFNALDWRWRDSGVFEALAKRPGVTVHARSALLQGLLANSSDARWPEGIDPGRTHDAPSRLTCELDRDSPADLCLAYVRAQSWIDGVVVGMESLAPTRPQSRALQAPAAHAERNRRRGRQPAARERTPAQPGALGQGRMSAPAIAYDRMFRLDGRTAFVSGAAGHLGQAMVRGYLAAGARVILNGRQAARLDTLRAKLRQEGHDPDAIAVARSTCATKPPSRAALHRCRALTCW